ncbi:6-bladed beta-propeller [Tannerella forsythia]|uniref:6-bladed beta-propeller n=1 Tax=Tannerella TaxID=195950 RepID=UPI000BE73521|nr:6-bladed beta-propeller [Tannerella forsythia]PDP71426.1 6-bladed beta-propeller [Tannerella forsythia]
MKNLYLIPYLLFIFICGGCSQNSTNEKHFKIRENIVNVHDRIKEIHIPEEDVLINNYSWPYIIDNYLIICDYQSYEKQLLFFDKNTYRYITGTADRGLGPGEITRIGHIVFNKDKRLLYVSDHGKNKIFSYHLDSIIQNKNYKPKTWLSINDSLAPLNYVYINDTLSITNTMIAIGDFDFNLSIARWNMKTGKINPMPYKHPDIKKKRFEFDASEKHNLYVESYTNHDLMIIADLNGNLICNIYGPEWGKDYPRPRRYHVNTLFCRDKIITLYTGGDKFIAERKVNPATKFLIFDLNGNHLKTLETDYHIVRFCYDEDHNRLIMSLNEDIQFAYLDLDGLLD